MKVCKLSAAFALLLALSCQNASLPEAIEKDGVSFIPMEQETLPALNHPRQAHALLYQNGELVVIGGHVNGFIPTATAEYLSGGKWHLVETLYYQDDPAVVALHGNGHIITAGGYAESFGIGQTWGVEQYNPVTHSFSYLPILDTKRTHATMMELDGGRLLVAGNWYRADSLEVYTPGKGFQMIKGVAQPRSKPVLLRSAPDNALIFGVTDNYGNELDSVVVDRLYGEPFVPALLQEWRPPRADNSQWMPEASRTGDYEYLLLVTNGRDYRVMQTSGESFSLLPLEHDIPSQGPWGNIWYSDHPQVDRVRKTAWLQGIDWELHFYLVCIRYGEAAEGRPAPIKVYYSRPLSELYDPERERMPNERPYVSPDGLLLPDGRFVTVGGGKKDYYSPIPYNYVFFPGQAKTASLSVWRIGLAILLPLVLAAVWLWFRRRRKMAENPPLPEETVPPSADLMSRIVALMEEREFFKRKDLRLADVASELGTNTTYISACINGLTGQNFPTFLNGYRVRFAQALMREHPDMLLSHVADESGFPNETTFLRNFKAQTGQSPSEWKAAQK